MKKLAMFLFVISFFSIKAQTTNKTEMEGDSLNATFVPYNMLQNLELSIVTGMDYVEIRNVNELTEVMMYDLTGKVVLKMNIDKGTHINKDGFSKGFYIIRTRSARSETIKKLYL